MQRSVQFAFAHPEESKIFIAQYAQEMEEAVRQQHINLYVNKFTESLGKTGKDAVKYLFKTAYQKKITVHYTSNIFIR